MRAGMMRDLHNGTLLIRTAGSLLQRRQQHQPCLAGLTVVTAVAVGTTGQSKAATRMPQVQGSIADRVGLSNSAAALLLQPMGRRLLL
jgi:hypothetical protein